MNVESLNVALAGGLLRAAEALSEASPFLMCGLIVAAVFRRLIGHAGVRTLLGDGGRTGLLRAWAVGMLLPVDALGVLPVARELRRAGLKGGTILAFALSAPLFNPLSLLYGLTLNDPAAILAFGFGSLVVVTGAGLLWDRLFPDTAALEEPPPAPVPEGVKRLAAVAVAAVRETVAAAPLVAVALVGPFLLGVVLPKGLLGTAVNGENPLAPLVTTAVAVPAYASPMAAMGTVGSMFQHGNSVGAAFAMLTLGAGTTLGLLAWGWRAYGLIPAGTMLAAIVGVTLALSYGIDRPLRPDGAEEGGHTHAFDPYTAPFQPTQSAPWTTAWGELADGLEVFEQFSLIGLGVLLLAGLGLRIADRRGRTETWLERPPADGAAGGAGTGAGRFDVTVPPPVLGGVALAGLAAVSVLLCYTYYPAPTESFEQLHTAQVGALSAANTGDRAQAEEFIPLCEDWAKRAQVGYVLRNGPAGDFQNLRTALYLDRLEALEHEVAHQAAENKLNDAGEQAIRREMGARIARTYSRMKSAYLSEEAAP